MRKLALVFLAVIAISVLSAPYLIRIYNGETLIFGEEPYYHARIALQMLKGELSAADTLVYNERPYFFGPYHVVLALSSRIIGIEASSAILPTMLGLVSFVAFYLVLGRFGINGFRRLLISLLLITSPAFIGTFSASNPNALAIPLYIIGLYVLSYHDRKKDSFLSAANIVGFIILLPTLLFGIFNVLLLIVLLTGFYTSDDRKRSFFLLFFSSSFLISLIYYLLFFTKVLPAGLLSVFISDLGGSGFGIFTVILLISGIIFSWSRRSSYSLAYFLLLYLISILLFSSSFAIPYLGFVIAIFAGEGLFRIINIDWDLPLIQRLTIILIVCGLLFSTVSFMTRATTSGPEKETLNGLFALKEKPKGVVFSHYSNGFWIEYFADKPVLLDGFILPGISKRYSDSNEIFYSRNIDNTKKLLDRYSIKYVFVDKSMRGGEVWTQEDEGLLFLFRNNQTFSKVYDDQGIQIWEYSGIQK